MSKIKEGSISIPIYAFSDGRYYVDTVLGGKRKRITRASLDSAKIEARRLLAQIGSGRQAEELLSISEAEDYRLAKEKLAPHGVTLLTAVEEWIGCCWRCCRSSSISFIYVPTPPLAAKKECTLCGWSQKLTGTPRSSPVTANQRARVFWMRSNKHAAKNGRLTRKIRMSSSL